LERVDIAQFLSHLQASAGGQTVGESSATCFRTSRAREPGQLPEYTSIPTTTAKIYAEFDGGTNFVATTPTGGAATDLVVARIGLSWLEVNLVGDSRYQQFLVKDATMSNWDMKP
jgi:hypothetical protein